MKVIFYVVIVISNKNGKLFLLKLSYSNKYLSQYTLKWLYLLGYTWVRTDKRREILIKNDWERQTYYGALDYKTKEFIVQELKKWKYWKYYGIC